MRHSRIYVGFSGKCIFVIILAFLALSAGCQSDSSYQNGQYQPYGSYPVRPQSPNGSADYSQPKNARADNKGRTPSKSGQYGKPQVVEGSTAFHGAPRTIVHEVGPLESVWRIAKMYGVTVESIRSANGLGPACELSVGQKLTVPNVKTLRHVINLYRNPQWRYIIVHHTATWKGNARSINISHGDRGFWNGLGYHFLIDNGTMGKGDGQIEMSPRWIRQQSGAHCKAGGMNDKSIGVALVGNFNEETPTQNQIQSLEYLVKTLCSFYKIPPSNIMAHGQVEGAKTECPGRNFPLSAVRKAAGKM